MFHHDQVYSKRVRDRLDALEAKRHAAELKVRDIEREIQELIVGQSVIGPGSLITWVSGGRERYGRVLSVSSMYRGFQYRVEVTTKLGRVIGMATVTEDQQPTLRG